MEQIAALFIDTRAVVAVGLLALGGLTLALSLVFQARAPDFYTRLHAVTPTYTIGGGLILAALAVDAWDGPFVVRLAVLGAAILAVAPAISHMLANAAHAAGLAPRVGRLGEDK